MLHVDAVHFHHLLPQKSKVKSILQKIINKGPATLQFPTPIDDCAIFTNRFSYLRLRYCKLLRTRFANQLSMQSVKSQMSNRSTLHRHLTTIIINSINRSVGRSKKAGKIVDVGGSFFSLYHPPIHHTPNHPSSRSRANSYLRSDILISSAPSISPATPPWVCSASGAIVHANHYTMFWHTHTRQCVCVCVSLSLDESMCRKQNA